LGAGGGTGLSAANVRDIIAAMLAQGSNITLSRVGDILTIAAAGGGGGSDTDAWSDITSIPVSIAALAALTPAADKLAYFNGSSTAALTALTAFARTLVAAADAATARSALGLGALAVLGTITASLISDPANVKTTESFLVAVSDEATALTTGTGKITFRMPYAFTLTQIRASVNTVSSSGLPTVDVKKNGTTVFSTLLSIDASEKTSQTAATPAVLSTTALADDDEITVDITVAGTGAKGLKLCFIGHRT
jgi:hypothetical protein